MGYKRLREIAVTNNRIIAFRDALPSPTNPYQFRKLKKLRESIAYALERMPFGASACERWERNREALAVTIAKGVGHLRATSSRKRSELAGPMRKVAYIFEPEGVRGGPYWRLVLECGHSVARKRHDPKSFSAIAQAMFRPLNGRLAPRRVQCHYCGSGCEQQDPAVLMRLFGGDKVP